jgi:hypothetical protein
MYLNPTELDDTLRAFEELLVSIVYTLGEFHKSRNNSTVIS